MRSFLKFPFSFVAIVLSFTLFSCSDKKEELNTELISDYLPLQPGKYITYRLDSLVLKSFGTVVETHRYQVKHVVDQQITDNLGRPSWRIYTYITDSAGTQPWTANGSYYITPLEDQVESTEDNMRFIKLHAPLREGFTWRGNSHLNLDPYASAGYNFSTYAYMRDWDYYYAPFETSVSYRGNNYEDVFTVEEEDIIENIPVTVALAPGAKYKAVEKYAKNIGLVYREYTLLEYEPNPSGANPYYTGFGITLWMIDHN